MQYHASNNLTSILLLCLQLLAPLPAPFMVEKQTVAAVGSAFNKASFVQSAQDFETQAFSKELNRGVMEVESMSGYQYNTIQAKQSLTAEGVQQKVYNIYEDIALSDAYLHGYFSQVRNHIHLIHR